MRPFRRLIANLTAIAFLLGMTTPAHATFLGEVKLPDGSTVSIFRLDDEEIEYANGRKVLKLHEKIIIDGKEFPVTFGMHCVQETVNAQYCRPLSPNSDTLELAAERILITAIIVAGVIYFSFFAGGSSNPVATATGSGGGGGGGPPAGPGGGPI
jgi:hypothetical protein